MIDLAFFNFMVNVKDPDWRSKFVTRFDFYYMAYLDQQIINLDEYQNLRHLLENWLSTMIYHTLYNEKITSAYEEYECMFRFPRYTLRGNTTIIRGNSDP